MSDPELVYTVALSALRKAEADVAAAETRLIHAQRAVNAAQRNTKYAETLRSALPLQR